MADNDSLMRERGVLGSNDTSDDMKLLLEMGKGDTKEDVKQEKNIEEEEEKGNVSYLVYQTMTALSVGIGGLVSSVAMGYTSPALPSMRADPHFNITQEQESWVGAVMPAAALVGSLAAGTMVDQMGRRTALLHLTWPFFLSWVLIAKSSSISWVIVGRLLSGACVGVQAVAGSVIMPEMVQLNLRQILMLFPVIFGNLGMLLSFWAGQHMTWRELAWLGAVLCLPLLPILFFLPETPHHLTRTGRRSESVAVLLRLRRTAKEAHEVQEEVDHSLQSGGPDVSIAQVIGGANTWPLTVAAGLMLAQQMTGITAVVFFASSILGEDKGEGGSTAVLLGVVNFIGTFVGMMGMASFPRRQLMQYSSVVVIGCLVVLGLHFWVAGDGEVTGVARLVPIGALLTYMLGFSLGWGPVPWVFLGEGLPSAVRGKAVAGVVAVNWTSAFVITKTFGWSVATLGPHVTFLSYAAATTALFVIIYPNMPETFMQSSATMDKLYLDAATKKQQ